MSDLSHAELSNSLYEISAKGYQIVAEADDDNLTFTYAIVDGNEVISSGETIECAVEEYVHKQIKE